MNFINIKSFDNGLYENKGEENRIADNFLVKALNVDLSKSGKIIRRSGYEFWDDLNEGNSKTSSNLLPNLTNKMGFAEKIQAIYPFTDIGNNNYLFIVTNGNVYAEVKDDIQEKQWLFLNKDNPFKNKIIHIKSVSYLDLVFFHDKGENVYYYNSQNFNRVGWIKETNKFIYFAGYKIYMRDYINYDIDTSNDITIEESESNLSGNQINKSLVDIGYIGTDGVILEAQFLKLGYAVKVNDKFYVLDNGKNERGDYKCSIIKFNNRLIAEDYVQIDMDVGIDTEIINFAYYDGYLYLMTKDGEINKISISALVTTVLSSGHIADIKAPEIDGVKRYSIAVNENGIFLYTTSLPDLTDWFQPLIVTNGNWNYNGNYNLTYSQQFLGSAITIVNKEPDVNFCRNILNDKDYKIKAHAKWFHEYKSVRTVLKIGRKDHIYIDISNFNTLHTWFTSSPVFAGDIPNIINILDFNKIKDFPNNNEISWVYGTNPDAYLNRTGLKPILDIDNFINSYDYVRYFTEIIMELTYYKQTGYYRSYLKTITDTLDKIYVNIDPNFACKNILDYKTQQIYEANIDNTDIVIKDEVYMLKNEYYNPNYFNSKTVGDYVMLIVLDLTASELKYKTLQAFSGQQKWRYMLPLTHISETDHLSDISVIGNNVYFGGFIQGGAGRFFNLDIETFKYEMQTSETLKYAKLFSHNNKNSWLLKGGSLSSDEFRISETEKWDGSKLYFTDFTDLETYNSNLNLLENLQIKIGLNVNDNNRLQALSTPMPVEANVLLDTVDRGFVPGVKYKYQICFLFDDSTGDKSLLSIESDEVEIPNVSGFYPFIRLTNIDIKNEKGINIFNVDDIEKILIYRKEKINAVYSSSNLIGSIDQADIGTITTFDDILPVLSSYNPFVEDEARKYKCNDICVHKNRLILINKLDYENSNVIFYSDIDMANSIPSINARDVESGDGDVLISGQSAGDYLFLFKRNKVYGILGDVLDGQLVDISKKIGCPYRNMILNFNNTIYFMNQNSIYRLSSEGLEDLDKFQRLGNYFDQEREDCIDFDNIENNGFVHINEANKDIYFCVPQKEDGFAQGQNNLIIIYDYVKSNFRTYKYHHNISIIADVYDILNNKSMQLLGGYDGKIFKITSNNNDDNKDIYWTIITKEFNVNSNIMRKHFKMLKVYGKFAKSMYITYWIDGVKKLGEIVYRKNVNGKGDGYVHLWNSGRCSTISVQVEGYDENEAPTEIEEILVGFEKLSGLR